MNNTEKHQFEMLVRVHRFGESHRELFPKVSGGGRALAAIAQAVSELGTHLDASLKAAEEGHRKRAAARQALRNRLKAINRTARAIGAKEPGFEDAFSLKNPSRQPDEGLLSAGRVFLDGIKACKDRFVEHGMPGTCVADLRNLVEAFGEAMASHQAGQEEQTAAQAGIQSALAAGLAAVRTLDVIVANQLEDDPKVLAVWEQNRRVDERRRSRRAAPASVTTWPVTPVPAVAAPAAATSTPAVSIVPPVSPASEPGTSAPASTTTPSTATTPAAGTPDALKKIAS